MIYCKIKFLTMIVCDRVCSPTTFLLQKMEVTYCSFDVNLSSLDLLQEYIQWLQNKELKSQIVRLWPPLEDPTKTEWD